MGTRRSTTGGQHSFAQIPRAEIQRSAFNRSCGVKTTFQAGGLYPIFVDEALPGDTFSLRMSSFARLATPLHPVMDNMFMDTHFFSVPIRLVWENWQKFNGEQDNPGDTTDYLVPAMTSPAGGYVVGSLSDYFGIPTGVEGLEHSALWHRAYSLIYNEWFRDQNMVDSLTIPKGDGPDDPNLYGVQRRGKRHDYFTSCLPWPQKGDAVEIPLGDEAPVTVLALNRDIPATPIGSHPYPSFDVGGEVDLSLGVSAAENERAVFSVDPNANDPVAEWNNPGLQTNILNSVSEGTADLSAATATTVNALRQGFQIQKLYERDARGGTRYTEVLRAHFGVISPDQRLQRPEYLGGGTQVVGVQPVPQTSSTDETSAQGNLAAYGTSSSSGQGFSKSFVEHCIIIGVVSARADLNYQQGLNRMFSRRTRWDFYWPALAHLGEQAVLNKEIFAAGSAGGDQDDEVFGYQERFAEYRYKPSMITGQFRSTYAESLDTWHLAQEFESLPQLNQEFIEEDPPVDRIIAVPSEPHFLFDAYFQFRCARPMPVYSVPGLIDHF